MRPLGSILLCAALAGAGLPALGQMCPANSVSPGDPCPGAASSSCGSFPAACPAWATTVSGGGSAAAIQNAINAASPGGVICVQPGVYTGQIDFKGKAVTVMSPTALSATLDGGGSGPVVTFASGEGYASVLTGFQIINGAATLSGGISIINASPTIRNCLVANNTATGYAYSRGGGAAIIGKWSAPTIRCTTFQGNHADYKGGGLEADYSSHPYLYFDTFQGNSAPYGGGVGVEWNGLASISDSLILNNAAYGDGGGLHVKTQFGTTLVRRTVIAGNTAPGSGGGMWVAAGFATVLNSVFDGNSASHGAGVASGYGSSVNVESSILVNSPSTDATLAVGSGDLAVGSSLLNSFNLFAGNSGPNYVGTALNNQILTAPVSFVGCYCLPGGSPAINAGMPDYPFDNAYNGQVNDMGAHGGPTASP
ncbi:MAG TPA: right-handed parallel beta-helix repeat-containing protein [Thermoanaerobaculia bacterium]|nr:right-handed parallel beta-helix repeat-containing protein [Thermoanaerobaculia bacterium]